MAARSQPCFIRRRRRLWVHALGTYSVRLPATFTVAARAPAGFIRLRGRVGWSLRMAVSAEKRNVEVVNVV